MPWPTTSTTCAPHPPPTCQALFPIRAAYTPLSNAPLPHLQSVVCQGNTPGHYAVAYHFYDLATWLFDPEGGGGDDTLENAGGLGV